MRAFDPDLAPVANATRNIGKALTNSRKEADAYKKQVVDLSPLSEFGDTPEGIAQSVQARIDEIQSAGSKAKIDIEKIRADVAKASATKIAEVDARNAALTKQLYTLNVRNKAMTSIQAAGAGETADLLMPFIEQQVVQVEEDGRLNAYVIDGENNRRFSSVTGAPMTVDDLVAEMKGSTKYARLFPSQAKSGGGADPNNSRNQVVQKKLEDMSSVDQISAGLAARARAGR